MPRLAPIVAAGCVLVVAAAAAADPAEPAFTAPPGCPQPPAFGDAIRAELGRDLRPEEAAEIEASVTRSGRVYRLTLRARGGSRTLADQSCSELVRAAALVVAIALSPDAGWGPAAEDPPDALAGQVFDPEVPGIAEPGPAAPPRPPRPRRLAARALVGADVGVLAGAGIGVGGSLAGITGPWRLEVVVHYLFPRTARLPDMNIGSKMDAALFTFRGCWEWESPLVSAGPCAGLDVGAWRAESFGVDRTGRAVDILSSTNLGFGATFPMGRTLAVRIDVDVVARERSSGLTVDVGQEPNTERRTTYRPSPVSLRTFTGLEVHFE